MRKKYNLRENPQKTQKYSPSNWAASSSSGGTKQPKKEPSSSGNGSESDPEGSSKRKFGKSRKKEGTKKMAGANPPPLQPQVQPATLDDLLREFQGLSVKIAKPKVTLKPFLGRKDTRTFTAFVNEFNKMANALNWNQEEMLRMLPLYLAEEEQLFYDSLPQATKENWQLLTTALAQHFQTGASIPHFRRMVILRRQRAGESPAEFALALKHLIDKSFPDTQGFNAATREDMSIDYFRNGLKMALREQIRHLTKPATLTEAIMQATEEEEALAELTREKLANAQVEQVNQINQVNEVNQVGPPRAPIQSRVQFLPNRFTPYNNNWRGRGRWQSAPPQPQRARFFPQRPRFVPQFQRGGFSNQRGFFQNRGRSGGMRRGRGGYRINAVRPLSPVMPLLTLIAVLTFLVLNAFSYQICRETTKSIIVEPPERANCTLPAKTTIEKHEIEIFVERKRPIIFEGFSCQKKIIKVCTFSILKLSKSDPIVNGWLVPVKFDECVKLVKEGKLGNKTLERIDERILRSKTTVEANYGFWGENCDFDYDYIVTRGKVYQNIKTGEINTENGFFENCDLAKKFCKTENNTLLWFNDEWANHCKVETVGKYEALVSKDLVLVKQLQAAFIFRETEENFEDLERCVGDNTFPMENGVFISIPKLRRILDGDEFFIRQPINWELGNKKKKRELKRARTMQQMAPIMNFSRPTTKSPQFFTTQKIENNKNNTTNATHVQNLAFLSTPITQQTTKTFIFTTTTIPKTTQKITKTSMLTTITTPSTITQKTTKKLLTTKITTPKSTTPIPVFTILTTQKNTTPKNLASSTHKITT